MNRLYKTTECLFTNHCSIGDILSYLFLLLIEILNDDTNKEIQCEEWPKNYKQDKIQVHIDIDLSTRLVTDFLKKTKYVSSIIKKQIFIEGFKIIMQYQKYYCKSEKNKSSTDDYPFLSYLSPGCVTKNFSYFRRTKWFAYLN